MKRLSVNVPGTRFFAGAGVIALGFLAFLSNGSIAQAPNEDANAKPKTGIIITDSGDKHVIQIKQKVALYPLLSSPAVQKELQLTPGQIERLEAKAKELEVDAPLIILRGSGKLDSEKIDLKPFKKMAENQEAFDDAAMEILNEAQIYRLRQIRLQMMGTMALLDDDVVKELKITDQQREQMMQAQKEFIKSNHPLKDESFVEGESRVRILDEENIKQFVVVLETSRKEMQEKMLSVLTDAQKKQWQAMLGKPFDAPHHNMPIRINMMHHFEKELNHDQE